MTSDLDKGGLELAAVKFGLRATNWFDRGRLGDAIRAYLNHVASYQPAPSDLDKDSPAPDGLEVVGKQYRMRVRDNPTSQWSQWSEWRHGPANVSFMLGDHAEYQERDIIDRAAADAEIARLRAERDEALDAASSATSSHLATATAMQARVRELEAENARLREAGAKVVADYDACSGAEPSLSVLHRLIDTGLRAAIKGNGEGGNG